MLADILILVAGIATAISLGSTFLGLKHAKAKAEEELKLQRIFEQRVGAIKATSNSSVTYSTSRDTGASTGVVVQQYYPPRAI